MNKEVTIIDNFLLPEDFISVRDNLMGDNFHWFYNPYIVYMDEKESENLRVYHLTHVFMRDGFPNSQFGHILAPLFKKIKPAATNRCQANLNLFSGETPEKALFHIDEDFTTPFLTGIYYVNTNNGYTEFETGEIVESKENRFCFFNHQIKHRPVTQTNAKARVVINFLYVPS